MSINAVKGVEIGDGFACVNQRGTEHRDEITPAGFLSNHAGGTSGRHQFRTGYYRSYCPETNFQYYHARDNQSPCREKLTEVVTKGRHDPCVGIRAVPVAEAMTAITLMDHLMRHRAQNADVISSFARVVTLLTKLFERHRK